MGLTAKDVREMELRQLELEIKEDESLASSIKSIEESILSALNKRSQGVFWRLPKDMRIPNDCGIHSDKGEAKLLRILRCRGFSVQVEARRSDDDLGISIVW